MIKVVGMLSASNGLSLSVMTIDRPTDLSSLHRDTYFVEVIRQDQAQSFPVILY